MDKTRTHKTRLVIVGAWATVVCEACSWTVSDEPIPELRRMGRAHEVKP